VADQLWFMTRIREEEDSRSFEIITFGRACVLVPISIPLRLYLYLWHSIAWQLTNGHSNTIMHASLECCTQTPSISVANLPSVEGTLFITLDGRTIDNVR